MTREDYEAALARKVKRIALGVLGAVVGLVLIFGSYYSVDEGERAVVTRMGKLVRITSPGGHFKMPLFESVTAISTRTECVEWSRFTDDKGAARDARLETYSFDRQAAHLAVKVCYRVKTDPASVSAIYSQFKGTDGYDTAVVIPRTQVAVKEVFGRFNAVRVIENRNDFNMQTEAQLRREIAEANAGDSIIVDIVAVQDIAFSDAYVKAVEERMQAEVEVTKVAQNLERERKQAEIKVVQAKADADSQYAVAEAQARATRIKGDAEAAAIKARGDALRENPKLVELTWAENWNGVFPTTMVPNGAVPFIGVK